LQRRSVLLLPGAALAAPATVLNLSKQKDLAIPGFTVQSLDKLTGPARPPLAGIILDLGSPVDPSQIEVPALFLAPSLPSAGTPSPEVRRALMRRNTRNLQVIADANLPATAAAFFNPQPMPASPHRWQRIGDGYNGCEGAQWITRKGVHTLIYSAHHDRFVFEWAPKAGLKVWRGDSPEATSFRPGPNSTYYVVEQGNRRLVRWNAKAEVVEVLADRFEGKLLNRPNDVALGPNQTLWFTDPNFLFRQRPNEKQELPGQFVFRLDLRTKTLSAPIQDLKLPNGIAIRGNELFVGDSGTQIIHRHALDQSATPKMPGEPFAKLADGGLDGLAFDPQGRLWAAGRDRVFTFDNQGKVVQEIPMPAKPTSIAFSESKPNYIAITTRNSVYVAPYKLSMLETGID
jgi:gluconolactonase